MTTWTDLSAGAVGVGGIPSGSTVTALRDNPIAIAEGSSGATRIHGRAIATAENGGLPVVTISAAATTAIGATRFEQVISGTFTTTTLVTVLRYTMTVYTGSARFLTTIDRGLQSGDYTDFNWYWKVDGVTAFTGFVNNNAGQSIPSRDIAFTAGQVITLEVDIVNSRGYGLQIQAPAPTANDGYVAAFPLKLYSE